MNDLNTVTYNLPSHWASALINGDFSGYEDDEVEQIFLFEREMVADYGCCWCIDADEAVWFTAYHDASHLGVASCDVSEFTFDIDARK